MFRGKESSNRIELSRLVQDLLNFGVLAPCDSGGGGWVDGVGGGWEVPHTHAYACACMYAHACTRACGKHDNFMQMAASIGFLGNPWEFPMMSYVHTCVCTCMHVCACACVWGAPSHCPLPLSYHLPTPKGGTLGITQNSIVLELNKIFQFCLKI